MSGKKITNFFDVSYWGEGAKKNLVEAELKTSSWEKDGKKFSCVEIRANKVRALKRPGEGKRVNAGRNGTQPASQGYSSPVPEAPDFDDVPPEMYDENGERIPF